METNLQTPAPNSQTQTVMPASEVRPAAQMQPQQEHGGSKKMLKLFLVILVLAILALGGYFAYSYFNSQKTYNAGVYNYPTTAPTTPTPADTLKPNDTSNSSIDSNNQTVEKSLDALDSDLNSVSDSFNDKQTNLQ